MKESRKINDIFFLKQVRWFLFMCEWSMTIYFYVLNKKKIIYISRTWLHYIKMPHSLPCYKVLSLDAHFILSIYQAINPSCDTVAQPPWRAPPCLILITMSYYQSPTIISHTPRCCGKARRHDLWHLKQEALKRLLSKSDRLVRLGRLGRQGDWLTGLEAKRDPEVAALKRGRQHIEGGRGGGRVLAITGLTD